MSGENYPVVYGSVCGSCGKPATGLASIGEIRFCHGDDDPEPTCYQYEQWASSGWPPELLREPGDGKGAR